MILVAVPVRRTGTVAHPAVRLVALGAKVIERVVIVRIPVVADLQGGVGQLRPENSNSAHIRQRYDAAIGVTVVVGRPRQADSVT